MVFNFKCAREKSTEKYHKDTFVRVLIDGKFFVDNDGRTVFDNEVEAIGAITENSCYWNLVREDMIFNLDFFGLERTEENLNKFLNRAWDRAIEDGYIVIKTYQS